MDVVFDFGNVLLEWNPSQLVREYFLHSLPSHHTPESFAKSMVNEDWIAFDNGDVDMPSVVRRLSRGLGCDEAALARFVEQIPHVLPPMPESIAALETLFDARDKGEPLRVFYLSNMPCEYADRLEERFAWIARFDGGIFSGRANLSKPNSAVYAALESRCALTPENTLFLDDSLANVEAAQSRGWRASRVHRSADVVQVAERLRYRLI